MHAWTEVVNSKAEHVVVETTVHPEPSEFLNAEMLYTGKRKVTYDPIAWFNELGWREDKTKTGKYRRLLYA